MPHKQQSNAYCTAAEPLDQPNFSQLSLLVWANEAAVAAYSYNFVNYPKNLQMASEYFTPEGWKAFNAAMVTSGNLQEVINKKIIVSAVATGSPIILEQGVIDEIYTWTVQMPLLVTFQSAYNYKTQSLIVTMLITRPPKNIGNRGLAIKQFIATTIPSRVKK